MENRLSEQTEISVSQDEQKTKQWAFAGGRRAAIDRAAHRPLSVTHCLQPTNNRTY